jgi:hypothetical protein
MEVVGVVLQTVVGHVIVDMIKKEIAVYIILRD